MTGALLAGAGTKAVAAIPVTIAPTSYTVPVTQPDETGLPVTLDTDVYLPSTPPPPGGYPLMEVFHGAGSVKDNGYDAGHAARFAQAGFVAVIYSQRGHGNSTGQTAVAGPKEMRDLFDVTAWALGIGGRSQPTHPNFHIDPRFVALSGYSQGGLNTNLGTVWSTDRSINPYGIEVRAIEPANTPDVTFQALVPNGVVKLSYVAALSKTYGLGGSSSEVHGRVAPVMSKWFADLGADQPGAYGSGALCDDSGHDTPTSTMQQDLAFRSVGCHPDRLSLPWLWAQAFDDTLFTPDMAIATFARAPRRSAHRLYLSMGGHAAPNAAPAVEEDRLRAQLSFMSALRRRAAVPGPAVVYWTRDPTVAVPASTNTYPPNAWYRQTSTSWPPPGTREVTLRLSGDGRATALPGPDASTHLAPLSADEANDPIAQTAASATPLGTTAATSLPATNSPGLVASFATDALASDRELSGSPAARLAWTPSSPDTQLVLELFDERPDGTLTLLSRGVTGLRGAPTGAQQTVVVNGNAISARIHRGDRVRAWLMAGDSAFYRPYPGSAGGDLRLGSASTLTLPLRPLGAALGHPLTHRPAHRLTRRAAQRARCRPAHRRTRACPARCRRARVKRRAHPRAGSPSRCVRRRGARRDPDHDGDRDRPGQR
jgi:hypothetical protein